MDEYINVWMNWMDEYIARMDEFIARIDEGLNVWMSGWPGWMNGWPGWMRGLIQYHNFTNKGLEGFSCQICRVSNQSKL